VKPNLARTDELRRALEQGISVKKAKRSKSALLWSGGKPPHVLEHSLYIPFYIFAVRSFDLLRLYEHISKYYRDQGVTKEQQIDGVFVIDSGILKNIKHREYNIYGSPAPLGQNDGWYFEQWGETMPLGILMSLEYSISSFPGIAESIMKRVLRKIGRIPHVGRLGDSI
jgi:hypothetical protein